MAALTVVEVIADKFPGAVNISLNATKSARYAQIIVHGYLLSEWLPVNFFATLHAGSQHNGYRKCCIQMMFFSAQSVHRCLPDYGVSLGDVLLSVFA